MFIPVWGLVLAGCAVALLLYSAVRALLHLRALAYCYRDLIRSSADAFDHTETSDEYVAFMQSRLVHHDHHLRDFGGRP